MGEIEREREREKCGYGRAKALRTHALCSSSIEIFCVCIGIGVNQDPARSGGLYPNFGVGVADDGWVVGWLVRLVWLGLLVWSWSGFLCTRLKIVDAALPSLSLSLVLHFSDSFSLSISVCLLACCFVSFLF